MIGTISDYPYQLMDDSSEYRLFDELDDWTKGYIVGKYWKWTGDFNNPLEYIEGFKVGCADVADYHNWLIALQLLLINKIDFIIKLSPYLYQPFIKNK
jgi:hypothetical protein